ncbi:YdbH domain-containing protein [Aliikangiella sp. G2MR2-5]|uniref:intermembrane phospholipid transport protein YdbH family protein n=1 Tax=Aliikangiella sp. G2MR2-5 TaxID=2788943 RepID=UPI0018AC696C|nr:YdbH domain-containing protein [Aliikangiella sp. G2MR2-5]
MKKKLLKFGVALLLVPITLYLSLPLWAPIAAKSFLPEKWVLTNIDLGYPNLNAWKFNSVRLEHQGYQLFVDELMLEFGAEAIRLSNLTAKVMTSTSPSGPLQLPRLPQPLPLDDLPFNQLTIEDSIIVLPHITLSVGHISFSRNAQRQFELSIDSISETRLKTNDKSSPLPATLSQLMPLVARIETDAQGFKIPLYKENTRIAQLNYLNTELPPQVVVTIYPEIINALLKVLADNNFTPFSGKLRSANFLSPLELIVNTTQTEHLTELTDYPVNEIGVKTSLSVAELSNSPLNLEIFVKPTTSPHQFKINSLLSNEGLVVFQEYELSKPRLHISGLLDTDSMRLTNTSVDMTLESSNSIFGEGEFKTDQGTLNITTDSLALILFENAKNLMFKLALKVNNLQFLEKNKKGEKFASNIDSQLTINIKAIESLSLEKLLETMSIEGNINLSHMKNNRWTPSTSATANINLKELSPSLSSGTIEFMLKDFNGSLDGLYYTSLDIPLSFTLSNSQMIGMGQIVVDSGSPIPIEIDWNRERKRGTIGLKKSPLELSLIDQLIQNKLGEKVENFALFSGDLTQQSNIYLDKDLHIKSLFKMDNGEVSVNDNSIQQLYMRSELDFKESIKVDTDFNAKKIVLASGLELSDFSSKIEYFQTSTTQSMTTREDSDFAIVLTDIKTKVMGGELIANQISLDSDGFDSSQILLNKLSLTELIFFLGLETLYGEGELDFELPLKQKGDAIVIENGLFKSKGDGIIKYDTGQDLSGSQNIAFKALQNFHYNELDGTLNYNNETGYLIKIHLLGSNPDLYDGRAVDFTFNIQGKLPGLFRSLFLSGNFEKSLLESLTKEGTLDTQKNN